MPAISSRDGVLPERRRRALAPQGSGRVAVLVAARGARRDWLAACLDSIDAQVLPASWPVELRIGVDGCEATSALLTEMGRGHWFSPEHVGPYVIRNSLITPPGVATQEPATHYATFDADDVMRPGYLARLVQSAGAHGIAGSARRRIGPRGGLIGRVPVPYAHGVAVYSAGALAKLGGFRAWPTIADDDLIRRAAAAGVPVIRRSEALYDRRRHDGMLSRRRKGEQEELWRWGMAEIRAGRLYVEPVITPLEWRASA